MEKLGFIRTAIFIVRGLFIKLFLQARGIKVGTNVWFEGFPLIRGTNVVIGNGVRIEKNVVIWQTTGGKVTIGDNCYIGIGTIINSSQGGEIKIGKDTLIAAYCLIQDNDHGTTAGTLIRKQPNFSNPIQIGNDCWLGASTCVLKGVIIEDGTIIGANSVVTKNISSESIAVGVPAKILKKREQPKG